MPGRPRSPEVTKRDEIIYALIAAGIESRSALADETGHNRDAVYLSCKRLQRSGRIKPRLGPKGSVVWSTVDSTHK